MRKTAGFSAAALVIASFAAGASGATAAHGHTTRQADDAGAIARSAIAAVEAHPAAAKVGESQRFQITDALVDPDGSTHVRMERTYRGLPVLGGDLVVHRGPGNGWKGTSQTLASTLTLGVQPKVTKAAAGTRSLAKSVVNRSIRGEQLAGAPRLVVDATAAKPRLAWEVTTVGVQKDGTPSRLSTIVDARTGKVLRTEQHVHTADGQGHSLYGGTVPLKTTQSGSSFQLKDPTRGGLSTWDAWNQDCRTTGCSGQPPTLFTDTDNHWADDATAERAAAAVDAQYD
ncbi:MAG: M4 family metallopeptidase, partial [Actinomycetes bacterium]